MPSRHGRPFRILAPRTANAKTCPGGRRSLEVVAAAGVLVRHIALAWKGTSLALPAHSRPRDPPRVLQDQQNPRKPQGRPNSCVRTRSGEESGYWESVPVGGGDYKRPVRQQGVDYLRAWTEDIFEREMYWESTASRVKRRRPVVAPEGVGGNAASRNKPAKIFPRRSRPRRGYIEASEALRV
jgi:hypothetical protein